MIPKGSLMLAEKLVVRLVSTLSLTSMWPGPNFVSETLCEGPTIS
jgi:hypothetical protein